jgi:hypothetical protein
MELDNAFLRILEWVSEGYHLNSSGKVDSLFGLFWAMLSTAYIMRRRRN